MEKKYRVIFHIDLNAFFASCEMAANPKLSNIPLGIGGKSDRGVLTTANYVARKSGVGSAMSVNEAKRLCPNLVVLPVNFPLYHKYSGLFFQVLSEYSDVIEKGSIDEGYLDMTDSLEEKHPLDIAKEIQTRLLDEYNLPVSIGIAPNMFLAKMASDMQKPLGITILRKRDIAEKLWVLPIEEMHGIGKKTYPNLKLIGIQTIGDLVQYQDLDKLKLVLGNRMEEFLNLANGNDTRIVDPNRYVDSKSIGNSNTYDTDLFDYQDILSKLMELTNKVTKRLIQDESLAKTVSIQVKYSDFTQITRSFTLDFPTDNMLDLYQVVENLYDDNQSERPIRLLGVSVSNLSKNSNKVTQMNLFAIPKEATKEEAVLKLIHNINETYGLKIIKRGTKSDKR